jgi:hypothetical protein
MSSVSPGNFDDVTDMLRGGTQFKTAKATTEVAKNGSGLAILFLNSALTLRRLPLNCAFGFC